jgi:purine-binding chemotaxis protein CheW
MGENAGRYLAFELGGQCYAVEVERVEVVLETVPITRVPKAPAHLRGVINYRGAVIPVADLGVRFGEGRTPTGPGTSIIVLQVRYGHDDITIGVLADSVREVIDLDTARIERPPRLGSRVDDALIRGIGEKAGEFIVVLDIDEAFKAEAPAGERGAESR